MIYWFIAWTTLTSVLGLIGMSLWLNSRAQLRAAQKQVESLEKLFTVAVESGKDNDNAFRQLLDKTVTMLGTKDPLAYQQVQAMTVTGPVEEDYDPSDFGELKREILRGQYDPSFADQDEAIDVEQLRNELGIG